MIDFSRDIGEEWSVFSTSLIERIKEQGEDLEKYMELVKVQDELIVSYKKSLTQCEELIKNSKFCNFSLGECACAYKIPIESETPDNV